MPSATYDLLDSTTLSTTATQVDFTSISQTYRDLIVVVKTAANNNFELQLGGVASNCSNVGMWGDGSSTDSTSSSNNSGIYVYYDSGLTIFQIMDYSATDKHKTVLVRTNGIGSAVGATAGRWGYTSAVSQIRLQVNVGSFGSGSTFYLYGVAA